MPRTWNNGMLILKERYSFINFVVKSEFCPYLNIPFPQTHYSIIPTFQHSNCERSELSSMPNCIQLAADQRAFNVFSVSFCEVIYNQRHQAAATDAGRWVANWFSKERY